MRSSTPRLLPWPYPALYIAGPSMSLPVLGMRRQRVLRPAAAQAICLFCACHLAQLPPGPVLPAISTRTLNTGRRRAHPSADSPAAAAGASREQDPPQWDPSSSLTPAEQAERQRLRQIRAERDRQVEAARADLAEMRRQEQARQKPADEAARAPRLQWRAEQQRHKQRAGTSTPSGAGTGPSRKAKRAQGNAKHVRRLDLSDATTSDASKPAAQRSGERRDSPFGRDSAAPTPLKVAAPTFGSAAPSRQNVSSDGWGFGYREQKRVQAEDSGEAKVQEESSLADEPVSHNNPNITTAEGPATESWDRGPFEEPSVPQAPSRDTILAGQRTQAAATARLSSSFAFSDPFGSDDSPGPTISRERNPGDRRRAAVKLQSESRHERRRPAPSPVPIFDGLSAELPLWPASAPQSTQDDNLGASSPQARAETRLDSNAAVEGTPQHPPELRDAAQARKRSTSDPGRYQATMLDSHDFQPSPSAFDDAPVSEWQHLRRRNQEPSQPTSDPQPQARQSIAQDPDWIDRQFNEHLQQRQQQRRIPAYLQQSPQTQDSPPGFDLASTVRAAATKCGRCLEPGHTARECTGPVRAKCHRCGQPGHVVADCPQRQASRRQARGEAGRGSVRQVRSGQEDDPFADAHAPEPVRERGSAIEDLRQGLLDRRSKFQEKEIAGGPEEYVLRSRKFVEPEAPKKARGRRREMDDEEEGEGAADREERNARKAARKLQKAQEKAAKEEKRAAEKARRAESGPPVNLPEFVSVATLAQSLGVRYEDFVERLEELGYDDVFPGKVLNSEISGMIAMEYGFEPVFGEAAAAAEEEERDLKPRPPVAEEDREFLPARPPVVTIMGHVDHGKTTILDYLRQSSVAAGEAGGITQHIGAFSVPLAGSGKTITFLDTPGHAAFLAMRQRGANVTDIVVLVVAADDSVKPQTIEAIKHAKAAGVPMIVAVNKIDKPEADLMRVKQDLARHGVEIEDYGGETQVVPVSGKTGEGMDALEENIVTLSEILDYRADTEGPVEGWVLEATTKKAGRVATVLVRRGTLRPGAILVAGNTWARVRTLKNEGGQTVDAVGPGMPVEVDGWRDQASAGDEVIQAANERRATDAVEFRLERAEERKTAADMDAINTARRLDQERQKRERAVERAKRNDTTDAYFEAIAGEATETSRQEDADGGGEETGPLTVPFIIKADVSGSAEAVAAYILSVSSPLISPLILRSEVGPINESDVEFADAARGHIIAFNLPPDEGVKGLAESKGVKVLENNVIYRVLDDVKAVMEERLPPVVRQRVTGEAEVGAAFEIGVGGRKKVRIAGCKVRNGMVGRGHRVRVMRGPVKVYDGESLLSLSG